MPKGIPSNGTNKGWFKKGHPKPKNAHTFQKRENSYNWKGGKVINRGYIILLKPDHPFCDSNGYIREHKFIIEQYIGRYPSNKESIHHINEIKTDNTITNLICFSSESAHQRFHKDPNNVGPEEIIFDGRTIICE